MPAEVQTRPATSKKRQLEATQCETFRQCEEFVLDYLIALRGVKTLYLDPTHDKCFCSCCEAEAGKCFRRGNPPERYVLPKGWCRFGVAVDTVFARAENVWDDWHVSFHGTKGEAVAAILRHRQLLLPGDVLDNGTALEIRAGHLPNQVAYFTSPTIRYAELDMYASPIQWKSASAKIVLQLRQRPGSYVKQAETVGWASKHGLDEIDPHFRNDEVEWKSRARGSSVVYGLLVRLQSNLRVEWTSRSLGLCIVEKNQIAKCHDHEYVKVGDTVKATRKLSFEEGDDKGCHVEAGDLGILVGFEEDGQRIVTWTGRKLGECCVARESVVKCKYDEYVKLGDSVKATCALIFSHGDDTGCHVQAGDLGIIDGFEEDGKRIVTWTGRKLGKCCVARDSVVKCKYDEYVRVGDTVKATRKLSFEEGDDKGRHVEVGDLGILVGFEEDGQRIVTWTGRKLGKCLVCKDGVVKCQKAEYLNVGDTVKATCKLSFDCGDEQGCHVQVGDLGILRQL